MAAPAGKYPHMETDDVAVDDCSGISRAAGAVRSEEIGTIRVLAYAPWYQTAEYEQLLLARKGKAKVLVDFKDMRIRRDL